jgi:hypothetical protein
VLVLVLVLHWLGVLSSCARARDRAPLAGVPCRWVLMPLISWLRRLVVEVLALAGTAVVSRCRIARARLDN